ncbi:MAG: hypothetical protein IJ958_04205 [Agathobacter sp.]|nr:hypothetical protein [Agathobacter sp.]
MQRIEKRMTDGKILLDTCNNNDFEHSFVIGQTMRITICQNKTYIGILEDIEDDYLILKTWCNGEKKIMYSEIFDIEDIINDSMEVLKKYTMLMRGMYDGMPDEFVEQARELKQFFEIIDDNIRFKCRICNCPLEYKELYHNGSFCNKHKNRK